MKEIFNTIFWIALVGFIGFIVYTVNPDIKATVDSKIKPGVDAYMIQTVKAGTLDSLDKGLTVGNALDNYKYFNGTNWRHSKSENGRNIVTAIGNIDLGKQQAILNALPHTTSATVSFSFQVNTDESFQLVSCGVRVEQKNGKTVSPVASISECVNSLNSIYKNDPDI